ncbi:MAG: RDD family protein [Phycisphaerae bacterium]|nr:RDD family protein [Phycisphaerae bacterium]
MINHPNLRRRLLLTLFLTVTMTGTQTRTAQAQQSEWKPVRLWVSGSKEQVWVVASNTVKSGDTSGEYRFWWTSNQSGAQDRIPTSSIFLQPFHGEILALGTDSDGAKVLASNFNIYSYAPGKPEEIAALWRAVANDPPLAWAGDDSQPITLAVVKTASLVPITRESNAPAAEQPATKSASGGEDALPEWFAPYKGDTETPETPYTLLTLRRGFWRRLAVPIESDQRIQFWIAGRSDRVFLFWRGPDNVVRFIEHSAGEWSAPRTVTSDPDLRQAWAGSTPNGPIFIAGIGPDVRSVKLELHTLGANDQWSAIGTAREGTDYLTVDALTTGVGLAMGRIAVARVGDLDQIQFAWADAEGSPVLRFETLTSQVDTGTATTTWRSMIFPFVVLILMTSILVMRREQVMQPAVLPQGLAIAPVWKRVAATFFDFMPAMFAGSFVMASLQQELGLPSDPSLILEYLQNNPEALGSTIPVYLVVTLVYSLWCLGWELASGTTLGKRVFGCRVISLSGGAASARQIIVRNVIRMLMVSMGETGWLITLLTMIMLTRNRQRLGDVLAGTLVVHRGPPGPIPIARTTDQRDDETPRV